MASCPVCHQQTCPIGVELSNPHVLGQLFRKYDHELPERVLDFWRRAIQHILQHGRAPFNRTCTITGADVLEVMSVQGLKPKCIDAVLLALVAHGEAVTVDSLQPHVSRGVVQWVFSMVTSLLRSPPATAAGVPMAGMIVFLDTLRRLSMAVLRAAQRTARPHAFMLDTVVAAEPTDDPISLQEVCHLSGDPMLGSLARQCWLPSTAGSVQSPSELSLVVQNLVSLGQAKVSSLPNGQQILTLCEDGSSAMDDSACAAINLRVSSRRLRAELHRLQTKIESDRAAAKLAAKTGDKTSAMSHLRSRAWLIKKRDERASVLLNVNKLLGELADVHSAKDLLALYAQSCAILRTLRADAGVSVEAATAVMDDLAEVMEASEEVMDTLGATAWAAGDAATVHELESELASLELEMSVRPQPVAAAAGVAPVAAAAGVTPVALPPPSTPPTVVTVQVVQPTVAAPAIPCSAAKGSVVRVPVTS